MGRLFSGLGLLGKSKSKKEKKAKRKAIKPYKKAAAKLRKKEKKATKPAKQKLKKLTKKDKAKIRSRAKSKPYKEVTPPAPVPMGKPDKPVKGRKGRKTRGSKKNGVPIVLSELQARLAVLEASLATSRITRLEKEVAKLKADLGVADTSEIHPDETSDLELKKPRKRKAKKEKKLTENVAPPSEAAKLLRDEEDMRAEEIDEELNEDVANADSEDDDSEE